jgi:hypothetical protein
MKQPASYICLLTFSMRVLPHDQDTGAFFIALLRVGARKQAPADATESAQEKAAVMKEAVADDKETKRPSEEAEQEGSAPKKVRIEEGGNKDGKIPGPHDRKWGEDPFVYLADDDETLKEVK